MKEYSAPDIRNFAVVGHASSGKTILCEAIAASTGKIGRMGTIGGGSTLSDYHTDEKEHQVSIHSSLLRAEWLDKKFNIIDTPGSPDFVSEALSALRVADFALVVLSGTEGVEVGTDRVWRVAEGFGVPRFLVLNLMDKEHTRFDEILEQARGVFGNNVFPITLPVNAGPGFNQVLDVMRKKLLTFKTDGSGKSEESDPEGDLASKAEELHTQLVEFVAESDDALLEKFFENDNSLSEEDLHKHIHDAVQKQVFIPLFSTSGEQNVGVSRLMDFIARYGSSPVDRATTKAKTLNGEDVEISLEDKETVAFVFKTMDEPHVGALSFFRVYCGDVTTGGDLANVDTGVNERMGQVYSVNGADREPVKTMHAGDIGATVKLKNTHTGNTLCAASRKVKLAIVDFPPPNTHGALHVASKGDVEKVAEGLSLLHEEDPTFIYRVDPELKQTIISGQGEIQLQVATERLKRRFNVEVGLVEPKVPYRETIRSKGDSKYRHKKQSGGAGQFAEVWMRVEPAERDTGVEFTNSLVGNNVDRGFVPSVEKGVKAASQEGVLGGFQIVDVKVDFYDGKQHPVDSKDIAFQIAGKAAFQECIRGAKPCLLEPIVDVRVVAPEECMGDVMGDISSRRGRVMGMDTEGSFQVINAQVPQAELYKYASQLRSLTSGRGAHTEEFSHYEEMPAEMEKKVIAASKEDGGDKS